MRPAWQTLLLGGTSAVLAAAGAWPVVAADDHLRILVLGGVAAGVALLGRRHAIVGEVVLGALILLALIHGPGPWTRVFLGVAAGLVLLAGLAAWRGGRWVAGVVITGLAVVALGADRFLPGSSVHTWNQYHYVVATKYFDEVGYRDLYIATLLADEEGARRFTDVSKVRDMNTYKLMTREEAFARAEREGLRARFTEPRWEEFKHDLAVFGPMMSRKTWAGVLTDLGYNPSPVWVVVQRPLLEMVTLERRTLFQLAALQIPMYVAMVTGWAWAFGLRATLWLVLWNLLFFGSRDRIYGGYWSYDWLALAVFAAIFLAKARPGLAAVAVGLGGLMRGFGGLLAVGPTVSAGLAILRRRRPDPEVLRFVGVLAVVMLGLIVASLTTARGAEAWTEWIAKIELHSYRISTGGRHLGLKVLFGEDWSTPGHTSDLEARRQIFLTQAWAYHLVQGLLIVGTLWVMRRRNQLDAALLGLIPAFALMVLSRYYYAAWSVLLLLGTTEGRREGRPVVLLGMFGLLAVHEAQFFVDGTTPDSRHQVVNLYLLGLAVAALGTYGGLDVQAWWRSRRPAASAVGEH